MVSKLGYILEILSLIIGIGIFPLAKKDYARTLFLINSIIIILTFLLLIYSFIISDFSLELVFFNSSTIKPLIYKIAGVWASHEGSIYLWLTLMSIISSISIYILPDKKVLSLQIIILTYIQLLFNSFIFFTSNPFSILGFKAHEGLGLNPVLQDVGLSFHPPILYLGFISYIVPYTYGLIILLKKNDLFWKNSQDFKNILTALRKFSALALLCLTLGVGLGSWWAYRELGWGGFWFFDPVENISLLPLLSGIILHHFLLITGKKGSFLNWTIAFSLLTFIICVYGTFLVRSGLLTSVHSFASVASRAIYLFFIFLLIVLPALFLFIKNYFSESHKEDRSFQEIGIVVGNIFIIFTILIIIISVTYPIIYEFLYKLNISISYEFFVNNLLPFFIPVILFSAIFISNKLANYHLYFVIVAGFITYILSYKINLSYISAIAIASCFYSMIHIFRITLLKTNYFTKIPSPGTSAMIFGHFGFALLALSIILNNLLQTEDEFIGKIKDTVKFKSFNVTLNNIKYSQADNYYRQIAEFLVVDPKNHITILQPENRFYKIEQVLSVESDIFSYLTYDLYAVLNKIDGELIYAQIYYRPFISFIWLAVCMIGGSFFIVLTTSRKYKVT